MNIRIIQPFLITVLALILFVCVTGQTDAPVSLSSSVDKSTITIGDLITYSVSVTHDKNVQVALPGFGANLGGFEIRDYKPFEPKQVDGNIVTEGQYTISTFFTGEFEIPPLTVLYMLPNDSTQHILKTEPIKITVESMKASEAGDIRDVKAPLVIPRHWWDWARWIVLGLCILFVVIVSVILYRRHKAGKSLLPIRETPPRPPHEVALEALDRLAASDLWEKGQVKSFYIELSEIIREYIGGRYFVVALEMTTTEVLDGLRKTDLSDPLFELFRQFLDRCDLVKFAKYQPQEEVHLATVRIAYDLVHQTKIVQMPEILKSSSVPEAPGESDATAETDPSNIEKEVVE